MHAKRLFSIASVLVGFLCVPTQAAFAADSSSLAGQWQFRLDPANAGIQERWFDQTLPGTIKLPGSLPAQGIGEEITVETKWTGDIVDKSWFTEPRYAKYREPGNVKVPFWLQPDKYYAGAAWYQREIKIPAHWQNERVVLTLERPHWETRVWLDGKEIGSNTSLSTAHEYDLGTSLVPGKHRLTIRVDNGLVVDVGVNSHSITDHTQGNWNGIVGDISLQAAPAVWIEELQVFPHLTTQSVTVKGRIGNSTGRPGESKLRLAVTQVQGAKAQAPSPVTVPVSWQAGGGTFEAQVLMHGNCQPWDEFDPALYRLSAQLQNQERPVSTTFGLRELSMDGTRFVLNGKNIFIRGTLECCIFPKTGHPPTDVESWKRIIRVAKSYGLNLLRFHSWCPPEAAFVAADELGFYYQVEIASWANQSTTLGDGKPVDQWLYAEAARILKAYGNHPSFMLMPYGNEPGGKNSTAWLAKWVEHWKGVDARRLYTSGSGWPQIPENQFHVTPDPRIQAWGQALKSRINSRPPETTTDYREYISRRSVPVISHEIGQWCVYPNFEEIPKYTGYLKAKNFEMFRDFLNEQHLGPLAKDFLLASGKLQALCYKEDIESALRTPGMGGFELLDLHDFPGQGTALVGVLDPFWEDKGYVTAKEYSRFCNATVPLARLTKRVFTSDEELKAEIEVAHFGPAALARTVPAWKLVGPGGKTLLSGELPAASIPIANGTALGKLSVKLKSLPAPERYKLIVSLQNTGFENDWDIWVYPPQPNTAPAGSLKVVNDLTEDALRTLAAGGDVLLTLPAGRVRNYAKDPVRLGFSSIFWNTAWTRRQAPTTLGLLCNPKHPALAAFPTDTHSNWQWWYLVHQAGALRLDGLPIQLEPIVRVIDDWVTARPLGLVVEAKVGAGRIVVCGFDLTKPDNPVARQMLHSLLQYMESRQFKPRVQITPEALKGLVAVRSPGAMAGLAEVKADSEQDDYPAAYAVDGDPNTFWHTAWENGAPGFPHELRLTLAQPIQLRAFSVLPRQDNNRNGWIKEYAFYVSADGLHWGDPVYKGTFAADAKLKRVELPQPREARHVKLVAISGHTGGPWASLAEFKLMQ